jgi:hypothetical protein
METQSISKSRIWTGRIMSGLVIVFMLFDAITKFIQPEPVIQSTVNELGFQDHHLFIMGLSGLIGTILYAFPATSILGAVLLTGHFGGAIASNLRVNEPLLSNTLFPVYLAVLMWGGIWLRDKQLQNLFPFKKSQSER